MRSNPSPAAAILLALLLAPAARADGLNLRWNACYGDGGLANRNSACAVNLSSNISTGSFVLPADLMQVTGFQFYVDVSTAAATLPAWWQFKNAGSCRLGSLSVNSTISASAAGCVDWSNGQAIGGLLAYTVGISGPNTARVSGGFAVASAAAADLVMNQEYFAFNMVINAAKTTGTGACACCTVPACLAFTTLQLNYQTGTSVITLTGPANGSNSNYVSWQGGSGVTPLPGGACAGFDTAGFAINTTVVGRGTITRSRLKSQNPPGSPVTLVAVPMPGDRFVAWSGDTASTKDTLAVIVVDHALSLVATFERNPAAAANLVAVSDVPGDEGASVRVSWDRSPLDVGASPGLVCCYEIERRPPSPPTAPWTGLAEVPVNQSLMYERVVSTPADSVLGDPALYRYRVATKAIDDPAVVWVSDEVEGYSVDNLSPAAPTSVSGSIASGFATLFWPAVSAPDVAQYRIYRGLESIPPTDAAHRIATTTATGYTDAPGFFANYRVTAVDVHGNEGQGTLFVPVNPADVDGRPAPQVLTVGAPTPSPMSQRMSFSLGLPRAMNVTVEILDPQGRLVRGLAGGVWPAGWFRIVWDARDSAGHGAAAGIYFLRVRTSEGEKTRRQVLLP